MATHSSFLSSTSSKFQSMSAPDEAQSLFDSGVIDYNEKRFEEALVKFRAAAAMGHGRAMNSVGVAFYCGQGVAKDVVEAYKWIKISAETGEPRALRNLAVACRKGVSEAGINVDRVEAMRLMRMAADAGLSDTMYHLADWLREANDPAALEWFMKGADVGNVECMMMVGELHRIGACGLQPDYSLALPWFERATAIGDADQIVRLANTLHDSGDLVHAVELYEKAVDSGSTNAMVNLGVCYERGHAVAKSAVKAVELYQRASDLGNTNAMANLGVCYANGDGVSKSAEKAVELYQRASDLGDATATTYLGVCYENGDGVSKSAEKAVELYQRASDLGDATATTYLGVCYENGDGVSKSAEKAVELYQRASDLGDATATTYLGVCYENGDGVAKSAEKAVELYQRASDLGDATATTYLGVYYERGNGVAKSVEKAVELYQRASDRGDAKAMSGLGVCFANGRGVATNFEKAVALFSRANELGDAHGTANLGVCYMNGYGVAASVRIGAEFWLRAAAMGQSNARQSIDSGMMKEIDEVLYGMVTGLMSGRAPDSAAARKLLETQQTNGPVFLDDFVFDDDNFPLDRIGDTLRLFAEFDPSIQSLQFALRLDKERPPACNAEQQQWFDRVAELIGGAVVDDGDKTMLTQMALLFVEDEIPLEQYEALKRVVDARVAKLTVKSVLPLVCVLEELDRAVRSLEFDFDYSRFALRACVFGAMCEHLLAAELPNDLTSETALETTLLWLGVVRQAEFFGGVQMERVAMVERDVEYCATTRRRATSMQ
jgi:TPR repeat protein